MGAGLGLVVAGSILIVGGAGVSLGIQSVNVTIGFLVLQDFKL